MGVLWRCRAKRWNMVGKKGHIRDSRDEKRILRALGLGWCCSISPARRPYSLLIDLHLFPVCSFVKSRVYFRIV